MEKVALNVRLDRRYREKMDILCKRYGVTKADLLRFMLDTVDADENDMNIFEAWYYEQRG